MTDKKISELPSITGANVSDANDVLPIVDTSAATTKKITRAELFNSVSSLTVGNTSKSGNVIIYIKGNATSRGFLMFGDPGGAQLGDIMYDHSNNYMRFRVNNSERVRIDSSGNVLCGSNGGGDIGSSTKRFKDLYLSGGVYLGGTGAANYLDDYEEGTWTPTAINYENGTMTVNAASYIKIGRLVWMYWDVSFSGDDGSPCEIGGWPFLEAGDLGDQARSGATVTFNSTNTNGLWNVGSDTFIFKTLAGNTNRTYNEVNTGQKRLGGSGFIYTS